MNKKIFYLCPQEEGKQEFVCWGFEQKAVSDSVRREIKAAVMHALDEVKHLEGRCFSQRSFSVLFCEDGQHVWVAIPRALSTKVMNIFNTRFKALNMEIKRVITSYNNAFDYSCPFYPVVSYDRGFIFDASVLETQAVASQPLRVVNA